MCCRISCLKWFPSFVDWDTASASCIAVGAGYHLLTSQQVWLAGAYGMATSSPRTCARQQVVWRKPRLVLACHGGMCDQRMLGGHAAALCALYCAAWCCDDAGRVSVAVW